MAYINMLNSMVESEAGMNAAVILGIRGKQVEQSVENGLPYSSLERLITETGFTREKIARALKLPERTLAAHKGEGRLSHEESDKIYRLARIYSLAVDMTSRNTEAAREWMLRTRPQLGGKRPIDLLGTDAGSKRVENLILDILGAP
jgi:putative toxin-antitoxin system antitoxin component (TIGR02293 family)